MDKPKNKVAWFLNLNAAWFFNPKAAQVRQQPEAKNSADHSQQEQQAVALINQGKLQEAEAIYRELIAAGTRNHTIYGNLAAIYLMQSRHDKSVPLLQKALEIKPNYPDAHNNLGVALAEQGDLEAAIASYNTALQLKSNYPDAHNNLGVALAKQGDLDPAIASYHTSLQLNPNYPDAYYNLGVALAKQGDLDAAIATYHTALQLKSNYPDAHNNLGVALAEQGDLDAAIASYHTALQLKPDYPDAYYNLGVALADQGDLDAAIASYKSALQLKPNDPDAHNNLGNALKEQGDLDAAIASYHTALQLNPNDPDAHNNLGVALAEQGDLDAAIASYHTALQLNPDYPDAHNNLGNALAEQGELDAAIASYHTALQLKPNDPDTYHNLGVALKGQGDREAAIASYRKASTLAPRDLRHAAAANLFFSDLHKDNEEIDKERTAYVEGIRELAKSASEIEKVKTCIATDMFWIAYHNRNDDRSILENLGKTFQSLSILSGTKNIRLKTDNTKTKEQLRFGICSDLLKRHTIGRLYSGMIQSLKREGFYIIIIRGPDAKTDEDSIMIDSYADSSIILPKSLEAAHKMIEKEDIDFLLYPDIGMSPYTYALAMSRLAPVQATSWGHPNTTGLDTIDYFLSCKTIEPDDAQSRYTEQLIKFTKLPCAYALPRTEISCSRSKFHLPLDQCLIGIPQSLFKFHPDYDDILEQIISRLPNAKYVLIKGSSKPQTDRLKARWAATAPKTLENSIFLDSMPHADYLCLLETVDILLDTIYFGSGNSFYEAMAFGTPVVTLPGIHMRGRIVAGGYKQMKLDNAPVAESLQDYIEITVRLAEDPILRKMLKREIKHAAERYLFNDKEAVDEIAEFIKSAVECNRETGGLLPVDWTSSKQISL